VPLVESPQFGIFNWESTVLVASWIEERFDKDWWQWSYHLMRQTSFQESL
jgi:hypothetical protein